MSSDDLFSGVLPFFYTAEERSYRRAAERLGISAAAVSKAVQRLEDRVGTKLLARTSRSVAVTPEGAAFVVRCREAIASITAGREAVSLSRRKPRGEVRVTLPFIVGNLVTPELVRVAERYPELDFRLSMTDRLVRLVEENIDVAVRIGPLPSSGLLARHLRASRWVTVASPSYLARHGRPRHPDDLATHEGLFFLAPNGRPREWTFRVESRVSARRRLVIDQGEHMLRAATAGLGICQVLDFMVGDELAQGRLLEILGDYAASGPPIHAVMVRERARTPGVRVFVDFLSDLFRRLDVPVAATPRRVRR